MAGYYLSPSLATLRGEVNAAHPDRDKTSDGWVGDTAHAARKSDHNPDYSAGGVVRALDIDHDGIDKAKLLRVAIADPRTEYVIQDWKIYRRATGFRPEKYTGSNGHTQHTHVSQRHGKQFETTAAWGYAGGGGASPPPSGGGGLSLFDVAGEVIAGRWGSGADRQNRLRGAGYDPAAVQAEVNRRLSGGGPIPVPARKSNDEIAAEVIAGKWGSGNDRIARLRGAGYDAGAVQAAVNDRLGGGGGGAPARKSVDQIAAEVIAGHWGNGPARSQRLSAAGYSPSDVQAAVNRRIGGGGRPATRLSDEQVAQQVINGQWGSGNERMQRISAAGYNYEAIRAIVNRMMAR